MNAMQQQNQEQQFCIRQEFSTEAIGVTATEAQKYMRTQEQLSAYRSQREAIKASIG